VLARELLLNPLTISICIADTDFELPPAAVMMMVIPVGSLLAANQFE